MTKIIVVAFTKEINAIEALHKLNELDALGDISIYEKVMFRKKTNGEAEVLNDTSSIDGWRTLTGMSIGALLGIIGGPIGLLIGMASGTLIGGIADVEHYDFAENFVHNVKAGMINGSTAIIAEIDEESEFFVDNSMERLGGVVFRDDVDAEWDAYDQTQVDEMDAAIDREERELDKSVSAEKEKIKDKIADLKTKRVKKAGAIKAKMERNKNMLMAQMEKLKLKVSESINEHKEKRINDKIERYQERLAQLNEKLVTV